MEQVLVTCILIGKSGEFHLYRSFIAIEFTPAEYGVQGKWTELSFQCFLPIFLPQFPIYQA